MSEQEKVKKYSIDELLNEILKIEKLSHMINNLYSIYAYMNECNYVIIITIIN